MELSHVKGLGPAKQESLKAAGIKTVEALAEVDLRKDPEVPGVSKEALKTYKQRARQTLAGNQASKATAKKSTKSAAKKSTKATAKKTPKTSTRGTQAAKSPAATSAGASSASGSTQSGASSTTSTTSTRKSSNKKGWLRRILRR